MGVCVREWIVHGMSWLLLMNSDSINEKVCNQCNSLDTITTIHIPLFSNVDSAIVESRKFLFMFSYKTFFHSDRNELIVYSAQLESDILIISIIPTDISLWLQ